MPPEFNTACPLASNAIVAATLLLVVVAFNKTALLAAPLATATFGTSVTGVYSVPVAVWVGELAPAASVMLELIVNVLPLPGAASVNVIDPVAGL